MSVDIKRKANQLVRLFGTRDPFEMIKGMNVILVFYPLDGVRGFYQYFKRNNIIYIDESLSRHDQQFVCAHELGHDQLHRNLAKGSAIQEFMLYDMTTKPEYEANIVAAEILLDTDEILEYIYDYGYTSEQIARAMGTDINLVALKIAHLAESGYDLRRIEHRSDFLK